MSTALPIDLKVPAERKGLPKEPSAAELSIHDLFANCSHNNVCQSHEEDLSSEDEEDYGHDDILSFCTSRRSVLDFQFNQPAVPLLPTNPPPLPDRHWCEPDACTFRVRDKSYIKTRTKVPSQPSLFRLFAVDMLEIDKPLMTGVCAHPNERIQKCLQAEKDNKPGSDMPPFVFCVNIIIPGNPAFHVVFYYAVDDKSLIDPSSIDPKNVTSPNPEFTKLASKFIYGQSDTFRDKTFKLVPRIADGSYLVKKAVGTKPTLLGQKVKQHYIQHERYFELIVDVGSDKLAKKITGFSRGYAESLVVDMAFLFEGKSASTLPENVFGTVRLSNLDFKAKHRFLHKID